MLKLYRFNLHCYHCMGSLKGVFVRDEADVANLIGKQVYFGEILGKHSDISAVMEKEHFQELTSDSDFIAKFEQYDLKTGVNPFRYFDDEEG